MNADLLVDVRTEILLRYVDAVVNYTKYGPNVLGTEIIVLGEDNQPIRTMVDSIELYLRNLEESPKLALYRAARYAMQRLGGVAVMVGDKFIGSTDAYPRVSLDLVELLP